MNDLISVDSTGQIQYSRFISNKDVFPDGKTHQII